MDSSAGKSSMRISGSKRWCSVDVCRDERLKRPSIDLVSIRMRIRSTSDATIPQLRTLWKYDTGSIFLVKSTEAHTYVKMRTTYSMELIAYIYCWQWKLLLSIQFKVYKVLKSLSSDLKEEFLCFHWKRAAQSYSAEFLVMTDQSWVFWVEKHTIEPSSTSFFFAPELNPWDRKSKIKHLQVVLGLVFG